MADLIDRGMEPLRFVMSHDIGPHVSGGISYGGRVIVMEFPKIKHHSRGWRKHLRKLKAAKS